MISVILPTYERPEAVLCALAGLENQTLIEWWLDYTHDELIDRVPPPFEVIVVDDSQSDGVALALSKFGRPVLPFGWRYMRSSPPRTGRFTAGRARNIGAANARGDLLVFIDQDVILAPDALEHYAKAYEANGDNTVIIGLYHWLPRMDFGPDDVRDRFDDIVNTRFPILQMDEPGLQGRDFREKDFTDDITATVDDAALGCFSGNIGYPRALYMTLGGFDEAINRHGGEDADLGLTAKEHGARFLQYRKIWGVHRWHPRNQAQNAEDVQHNIDYIDRKHGIGKYADARKWMDARDWTDPRHYHKEVGGVLMQASGDKTVWVCRDGHRLGLAEPEALKAIGFKLSDGAMVVPASSLEIYEAMGVIGG